VHLHERFVVVVVVVVVSAKVRVVAERQTDVDALIVPT
jgi:hypothetical protein